MENNICNSMILTSRRRHFYLVGQSKHKVGACGVNNQASAVLAGNELPFVAFFKFLLKLLVTKDGNGIWNQSPNQKMVYAISRQIWKRHNELVAKSRNPYSGG
ncbi:hypothetical protein TNCV_1774841 [Trichonephila clavipes]|nr:hypothetical protein TNCV_1774841 [Trichonephila clavipes]